MKMREAIESLELRNYEFDGLDHTGRLNWGGDEIFVFVSEPGDPADLWRASLSNGCWEVTWKGHDVSEFLDWIEQEERNFDSEGELDHGFQIRDFVPKNRFSW